MKQRGMDWQAYRDAKQQFVTGHEGTSKAELLLLVLPLPLGLLLCRECRVSLRLLQLRYGSPGLHPDRERQAERTALLYVMELLCLLAPMLAGVLSSTHAGSLCLALAAVGGSLRLYNYKAGKSWGNFAESVSSAAVIEEIRCNNKEWSGCATSLCTRPYSLTSHRACVMLSTVLAILAVDFPVFPRRFAKAEVHGIGMMDFGSAAFVFTSGLMQKPHQPRTKFTKLITSSWPLALLASARLVAVKLTGYPEHVTEYGVHWNFFATLSCLRVASHFTGLAINAARAHGVPAWCTSFGLAAAIIAAWQCMLMNGMHEYILTAPRGEGVFSENREGICGVAGYLAVFLIAQGIGTLTFWTAPTTSSISSKGQQDEQSKQQASTLLFKAVLKLAAATAILLAAAETMESICHDPPSRRLMNAPFILWSAAHSTVLLLLLTLVDLVSTSPAVPRIYSIVSSNMMSTFLIANLLTGAVNLSCNTLLWHDNAAAVLLTIYIITVVGAATLFDATGIRVRL